MAPAAEGHSPQGLARRRPLSPHVRRGRTLNVERPEDFTAAFAEARKNRAEALVVSSSPLFYLNRARLVALATKHRLPAIYHQSEFVVESGGLMSYGPDFRDLFKRSATYFDRILKGAKPGDMPVQQPTKFELVVNLKAAKALALTIPRRCSSRRTELSIRL